MIYSLARLGTFCVLLISFGLHTYAFTGFLNKGLTVQRHVNQLQMVAAEREKWDKINTLKFESDYIRHPLKSELANEQIFINHDAYQLLKFHGSYMQDNRDNRKKGEEKDYSFMLRLKTPAGVVTPELFKTLDDLSRDYGHKHLRLTTRQTFQLHGVLKGNLKHVVKTIFDVGSSTIGGCGDVNRNINCTPAPIKNKMEYVYARKYSKLISEVLKPSSPVFSEIWHDGEKAASVEFWKKDIQEFDVEKMMYHDNGKGIMVDDPVEPLYGPIYLPRKYKMAVTVPGDNSVDIYTNDVGLVVITDDSGNLKGFNIMVGGGMGRTHNKESTFARAADHLGFVDKDQVIEVCKAILATQRDYGNREIRANARMKYLVDTCGIDKFRELVNTYLDVPVQPWHPMKEWKYSDWMGWHDQGDGNLFLGVNIEQGRVKDEGSFRLKTALRLLVDKYNMEMVCAPNQSLILCDIPPAEKHNVESVLRSHGVKMIEEVDPLTRLSMACPALPMCGLAITEAERRMPEYMDRIRVLLDRNGLGDEEILIRMTGCPNGCARPYMAELAFVGDGPQTYQLWLGGCPVQTRVGFAQMDKMKTDRMEEYIEPLLQLWKAQRQPGEAFGNFCHRVGQDSLAKVLPAK